MCSITSKNSVNICPYQGQLPKCHIGFIFLCVFEPSHKNLFLFITNSTIQHVSNEKYTEYKETLQNFIQTLSTNYRKSHSLLKSEIFHMDPKVNHTFGEK